MVTALQLNANRRRVAHDLLLATALALGTELLLVSEPNLAVIRDTRWKVDTSGDSAILVLGNMAVESSGKLPGAVWVELKDLKVYSCYFSPNKPDTAFAEWLEDLAETIRPERKSVVVTGDFNAKSTGWGCPQGDERGQLLEEWAASLGLVCLNEGDVPTFERANYGSVLDLTFGSEHLLPRLKSWRVTENETLSDHRCIAFEISSVRSSRTGPTGWKVGLSDVENLKEALLEGLSQLQSVTPDDLSSELANACARSGLRRGNGNPKRKAAYWWTDEIAELRRNCLRARRKLTRERRRTRGAPDEAFHRNLADARSALKAEICKTKQLRWKDLLAELEDNPWGDAYRIVRKKFGQALPALTAEQLSRVVGKLFPSHPPLQREEIVAPEVPLFTGEEVRAASARMKMRKSPGPDGVPPEVVRLAVEVGETQVCQAMNHAILNEDFPPGWKEARLVLLKKEGKPDGEPSSYRPLCLLNVEGKLLEQLLYVRIREELENGSGLSPEQHGFREGKSTADAITRVMAIVDRAAQGTPITRRIPAVILLDVRNAFNSAPWNHILEALRRRHISPYLLRMVQKYLGDRWIVATPDDGKPMRFEMSCGVPQGSVLGPILWNVLYDDILRQKMPEGVTLIGYADDLALVVTAHTEAELMLKADHAVDKVDAWLKEHGLELAPEKTEAVVMAGRRKLEEITFRIGNLLVKPTHTVKYLGVWLDHRRSFQDHVQMAADKATKVARSLTRLMANIGGPSQEKRKLLATVAASVALYAAPVWARALQRRKARDTLTRVQRIMAVRVCSAYRTISNDAVLVIAGIPPVDLTVEERVQLKAGVTQTLARATTVANWQKRWEVSEKGRWTWTLIPEIQPWLDRGHGQVDFYLTQFLSGHGKFREYLYRKKRADTPNCQHCGEMDTANHTVLVCPKWDTHRVKCAQQIGILDEKTIVQKMLDSPENWSAVQEMVRWILQIKMRDE